MNWPELLLLTVSHNYCRYSWYSFVLLKCIFWLRIFIYLFLFCSTTFFFLYIFSGGSTSTYDYSVELNKFLSFFFLLFGGCGTVFRLASCTSKWLLIFSLYLLIFQFGALTLMMDVHAVYRNVTWAACLLRGGALKNTLWIKLFKNKCSSF